MTQEDPRILELRRVRAKALEGGGEERNQKQKAKGKLTARERVKLLLDKGTFNEIEPFITHQGDEMSLLKEKYYGDGVITGYGQINGRTVYLYSQDFTIYGGTLSEMQSHKICRVMDLAVRNGVPFISLIDSAGHASRKVSVRWADMPKSSGVMPNTRVSSHRSPSCSDHAPAVRPTPPPCRTWSSWWRNPPSCS